MCSADRRRNETTQNGEGVEREERVDHRSFWTGRAWPRWLAALATATATATATAAGAAGGAGALGAAPPCEAQPERVHTLGAGAEDIVALPLAGGAVRLFMREVCRSKGCTPEQVRIGQVDVGPDGRALAPRTDEAWRPPGEFDPLGLSLEVDATQPGRGRLTVLDLASPAKIWRHDIVDGRIVPNPAPWFRAPGVAHALGQGNDLQASGEVVHVSRFDKRGFIGPERPGWPGVLRVTADEVVEQVDGWRGSNGIVAAGTPGELIVADYWQRRLRRIDAQTGRPLGFASAVLDIHPDNLSTDGRRVWIAGQHSVWRTALHLLGWPIAAPSAVWSIAFDQLGPAAVAEQAWDDGGAHGRAVSVAVPVPGGLALGQIRAPDVLLVRCPGLQRP
jgi:hypothetical protein